MYKITVVALLILPFCLPALMRCGVWLCNTNRLSCKWWRSQTSCVCGVDIQFHRLCYRAIIKQTTFIDILLNKFDSIRYVFDLSFALKVKKTGLISLTSSRYKRYNCCNFISSYLATQRNFISFFFSRKSDSTNWFILSLIWKVFPFVKRFKETSMRYVCCQLSPCKIVGVCIQCLWHHFRNLILSSLLASALDMTVFTITRLKRVEETHPKIDNQNRIHWKSSSSSISNDEMMAISI